MTLIKPENIAKLTNNPEQQKVKIKLESKTNSPHLTPRLSNQVEALKNGLNSKFRSIKEAANSKSRSRSPSNMIGNNKKLSSNPSLQSLQKSECSNDNFSESNLKIHSLNLPIEKLIANNNLIKVKNNMQHDLNKKVIKNGKK